MKKFLTILILIGCLVLTFLYKEQIISFIYDNFIYKKELVIPDKNNYYLDYDFKYVKNTDDFDPDNKQELMNIFYTILNSGWSEFTFYCSDEYNTCADDIDFIINDNDILPTINNYVHPFNSYKTFSISVNELGRVLVKVDKLYNENDIILIENKVNAIIEENISSTTSTKDKITKIHDYIINNTKYDEEKIHTVINDIKEYKYKSNIAYGPLINGISICGGYTDAMSIILHKLGIMNFKISNENHVWNAVNLDNKWLNVDLTWDDPTNDRNIDILQHNFFLITTDELLKIDTKEHTFNKDLYPLIN